MRRANWRETASQLDFLEMAMGENTLIEWAHSTFNAWVGCQKNIPRLRQFAMPRMGEAGQAGLWQGEPGGHTR